MKQREFSSWLCPVFVFYVNSLKLNASATAVLRTKHSHKGSKCPYMLLAPFADVQMPSLHEELPHIHWFILKDLV